MSTSIEHEPFIFFCAASMPARSDSPCPMSMATSSVALMADPDNSAKWWPSRNRLLGQFVDVVDARHRHHGIASQVRGDGNRLGLAVGDYAHAHFRRGELGQFALELVAEIAVLQRMYGSHEFFVRHEGHSRSFGTQMRVVVGTVEYVVNALLARDATEKTGHTNIS